MEAAVPTKAATGPFTNIPNLVPGTLSSYPWTVQLTSNNTSGFSQAGIAAFGTTSLK